MEASIASSFFTLYSSPHSLTLFTNFSSLLLNLSFSFPLLPTTLLPSPSDYFPLNPSSIASFLINPSPPQDKLDVQEKGKKEFTFFKNFLTPVDILPKRLDNRYFNLSGPGFFLLQIRIQVANKFRINRNRIHNTENK